MLDMPAPKAILSYRCWGAWVSSSCVTRQFLGGIFAVHHGIVRNQVRRRRRPCHVWTACCD